jgi:hypothetical protein
MPSLRTYTWVIPYFDIAKVVGQARFGVRDVIDLEKYDEG